MHGGGSNRQKRYLYVYCFPRWVKIWPESLLRGINMATDAAIRGVFFVHVFRWSRRSQLASRQTGDEQETRYTYVVFRCRTPHHLPWYVLLSKVLRNYIVWRQTGGEKSSTTLHTNFKTHAPEDKKRKNTLDGTSVSPRSNGTKSFHLLLPPLRRYPFTYHS